MIENDLKVENCIANITDRAASMQGKYNRLSAGHSGLSSGQIYDWCYSHTLNLILSDVTKTPLFAASSFSLLNGLSVFFFLGTLSAYSGLE